MSKVIKSSSVKLASPKIIEIERIVSALMESSFESRYAGLEGEPAGMAPQADNSPDAEGDWQYGSEQNVEHVKQQAGEILRETEQMVKDLLETARQEAEKIIRNANGEAARIVTEGRDQAEQAAEEARRRGYREGAEEGAKAAEDQYREKMQEAEKLVETAHVERREIVAAAEDEIVQLAVAVARKIISEELKTNPDIIVDIVKRAVQKASDREELTVRVHPDNLDSTLNAKDEISQSVKGVRKLKVLADQAVAPGGCVVESPNGTVDARVERQLSEIEQALMEVGPNAEI